jgi:putative membrane protein
MSEAHRRATDEGQRMAYEDLGDNDKMSSMRTSLSFQRTRMAADRTLMATMRTSLSLIGFGFTIFSFFQAVVHDEQTAGFFPPRAPARFGLALVFLGVLVLGVGIFSHFGYMKQLRGQRAEFIERGLMPGTSRFPVHLTLVNAFLLVLVGVAAIVSIMLRVGPFR